MSVHEDVDKIVSNLHLDGRIEFVDHLIAAKESGESSFNAEPWGGGRIDPRRVSIDTLKEMAEVFVDEKLRSGEPSLAWVESEAYGVPEEAEREVYGDVDE